MHFLLKKQQRVFIIIFIKLEVNLKFFSARANLLLIAGVTSQARNFFAGLTSPARTFRAGETSGSRSDWLWLHVDEFGSKIWLETED